MKRLLACLALITVAVLPATAKASLIGDTVNCTFTAEIPTAACAPPSAVVIEPGSEFVFTLLGVTWTADIGAATILLTGDPDTTFATGSIVDLLLSSLNSSGGPIVGFTVDIDEVAGMDASNVSTGPDFASFDFQGSVWDEGDRFQITLQFAGQSVSEPATLFLVAVSLLGLALSRRSA